jgi:hypothetical protein
LHGEHPDGENVKIVAILVHVPTAITVLDGGQYSIAARNAMVTPLSSPAKLS